MKSVALILTLNTSIMIICTLYVSNKMKKLKNDINNVLEMNSNKISNEEVSKKIDGVVNKVDNLINKVNVLDDNCNDKICDIKVDLELQNKNIYHMENQIVAAVKNEISGKIIKLKKKRNKKRKPGKK